MKIYRPISHLLPVSNELCHNSALKKQHLFENAILHRDVVFSQETAGYLNKVKEKISHLISINRFSPCF